MVVVDDDFVQVIQYLRGSVCGFSGRLPDVCCPKEKPVGDKKKKFLNRGKNQVFGAPPLPPVPPPSGEQPPEQSSTEAPGEIALKFEKHQD